MRLSCIDLVTLAQAELAYTVARLLPSSTSNAACAAVYLSVSAEVRGLWTEALALSLEADAERVKTSTPDVRCICSC